MEEFMMMKIEKLLTITDTMKNGKKTEIAKVQDFDKDDIKMLDKTKFKKGKSQRGVKRLESKCFVILEDDFEDYEKDIHSQIQSLESTIANQKKTIEELENRLSSIDGDHEEETKKIADEYSDKVDQLKADLHEKDLEIERTKTKYESEIGDIKKSYEARIGEFREEIQKEINELELFDADKHMTIKAHNEELSNLELFDAEYHMKKEDHQKALNKMRGNCLKLRVRENKEYSSYIEQLDKLGRLAKFRNHDKPILKEMELYNKSTIDEEAIDVQFNLIDDNNGRDDE